jgi:PPP family 3-phenylpropionic acid transporter
MRKRTLPKGLAPLWGVYGGYFMGNAVYSGYIAVYLRYIGIDSDIIGLLTGLPVLASMFFQPYIGLLADRARSKNVVLLIITLLSTLCMAIFSLSNAIWYLTLLMFLFNIFQNSIVPIMDAMTFELAPKNGFTYGSVRIAGSILGSLMLLVIGRIMDWKTTAIFPLFVILNIICMVATMATPKVEGHQTKGSKITMGALLKNRHLTRLIFPIFVFFTIYGFSSSFFGIMFTQDLGNSTGQLGLATFLNIIAEIPILIFSKKLYERFGAHKIFFFGLTLTCLRCLMLGLVSNSLVILLIQLCTSGNYILIYMPVATFFNDESPMELKASAQMLMVLVLNLGRTFGCIAGGYLNGIMSLATIFLLGSGLVFSALLWLFYVMMKERRESVPGPSLEA